MKKILLLCSLFISMSVLGQDKYKCMIQMANYTGEGAYVVVSLVNNKGKYQKTLQMLGDDNEWYNTLKSWFEFFTKKRDDIDAVTGASIAGGDRKIITLELDPSLLDKGYTIRFESAVEDQNYHKIDAEVQFSSEHILKKTDGKGYIRYVKFNKIN